MTKKERVAAAFQGKETDRVPVCMWKHVPPELWDDDEKFVQAQLDFYKATDVDFMKLSADGFFGWPSPVLKNIEKADELYEFKPFGADHPHIRRQIERAKKVVEGLNGECYSLYLIFCPLSYLRLEVGYPKMMKLIRENPEAVKYACNIIAEDAKILVKGIIEEAGCDGIFYSVQNGEVNRFTHEEYRNWVTPSDKAVLDYANTLSNRNAIHFCGWEEIENRLENWEDYHAPVISWSRYVDNLGIQEAKNQFHSTVWGGFDNRPGRLLYTGTREEIEQEVRAMVQEGGKSGYILGADCSIHDELPEERIKWVVDIAKNIKWGNR